jgi:hypothetical protein
MTETVHSSEILSSTKRSTWCHNPEEHHNLHCHENLKSHFYWCVLWHSYITCVVYEMTRTAGMLCHFPPGQCSLPLPLWLHEAWVGRCWHMLLGPMITFCRRCHCVYSLKLSITWTRLSKHHLCTASYNATHYCSSASPMGQACCFISCLWIHCFCLHYTEKTCAMPIVEWRKLVSTVWNPVASMCTLCFNIK